MKKPELPIDISGSDGNIYVILSKVMEILRKQRRYTDFNNLRDAVYNSGDYNKALYEIDKVVTLIDLSEKRELEKRLKEGANNG